MPKNTEIDNNAHYRKIRHDTWGKPHRGARTDYSRKIRARIKALVSKILKTGIIE